MFLLLTFPLVDEIEACIIIWKLLSLGFKTFLAFHFQMDYFAFPKHQILPLKFMKKEKCGHHKCHFWSTLECSQCLMMGYLY